MTRPGKKGCKFPFNKILIKGLDVVGLYYVQKAYRPRLMQVLSYETYYLAFSAYNIYCYFIYNVFYHIMFHFEPQSCIYPCRTTYMETKQMGNSTNLAGKIEHVQFTVQD